MTGGRASVGAIELRFETDLGAPLAKVWAQVSTFDGINAELAPLVKMTFPAALRADGFDSSTMLGEIVAASRWRSSRGSERPDRVSDSKADSTGFSPGVSTGVSTDGRVRCWLLVAGYVPLDRHAFGIERMIEAPTERGFDEESTSWLQRRWRHERRVTALDEATCRVTDHLSIVPRLSVFVPLVSPIVRSVFRHRHRRLVRDFGFRSISTAAR